MNMIVDNHKLDNFKDERSYQKTGKTTYPSS